MRIRPDGVELLRLARTAIDTAIRPHLAENRRGALHPIEAAIALAEDRLTRDMQASAAELVALDEAGASMRGEVLQSLAHEHRYDARLVAKAIAIAAAQLADAHDAERREHDGLTALLGTPAVPPASRPELRRSVASLNQRLVAHIRAGEADPGTSTSGATLAFLKATALEARSGGGPAHRGRQPEQIPAARPTLAARSDTPRPMLHAYPLGLPPARLDGWVHLYGAVGQAMFASSNAALTAQVEFAGWYTQRLAANPRVPMAVVEGAHQVHDFVVAFTDATAAFARFALGPFRPGAPRPTDRRVP